MSLIPGEIRIWLIMKERGCAERGHIIRYRAVISLSRYGGCLNMTEERTECAGREACADSDL